MPKYELLYIVPNKYTEEEVTEIQTKIKGLIQEVEGEIKRNEFVDRKKLAYPIKHINSGYYVLTELEMKATAVKKLKYNLKLTAEVLRHQIIKLEPKSEAQIAKEKALQEKIARKVEAKKESQKKEFELKTPFVPPHPSKEPKKKVSMEELDKKLDEILSSDIL